MIEEKGTIVACGVDHIWVETIQSSACATCAGERGCGQRLLSKLTGKTTLIRVLTGAHTNRSLRAGDTVTIGIPENVVVTGSLLVYAAPLAGLLGGAWFGQRLLVDDIWVAMMAAAGLFTAGAAVRFCAWLTRNRSAIQPILLSGQGAAARPTEGQGHHLHMS